METLKKINAGREQTNPNRQLVCRSAGLFSPWGGIHSGETERLVHNLTAMWEIRLQHEVTCIRWVEFR